MRVGRIRLLILGFILYAVYRRYVIRAPRRKRVLAPVLIGPAAALEYRSILVTREAGARVGRRRSTSRVGLPPIVARRLRLSAS